MTTRSRKFCMDCETGKMCPACTAKLPQLVLTRLSDVTPRKVEWLWPGRLPLGKIVTLDGDPGLGKSTLAIAIAAVTTTGGRWPDGGQCEHPGDVLLLSGEDGAEDTVRPRADAAGADATRIHVIEGNSHYDPNTGERYLTPLTLADVFTIDAAMAQTSARLLIVDVLMAFLPSGTDSHKDQDIRRVLSALASAGERNHCTVLLLRHLNKAKGGDPIYRGGGSIGIVGAARAGLLVATDPDEPDRRILASVKSNLGPAPESMAYRLVESGEHGVARVQWEGQTTHTAHTLLSEPSDDDGGAQSEAEFWLHDFLTEQGAVPSKNAKAAAAKAGIKDRTLQRAAKKLRVVVDNRGFPRVTWWQLPSRDSQDKRTPVSQNLGATGATSDDLHKQNGATVINLQSRQVRETGATARNCTGCGTELNADNPLDHCAECAYIDEQNRTTT